MKYLNALFAVLIMMFLVACERENFSISDEGLNSNDIVMPYRLAYEFEDAANNTELNSDAFDFTSVDDKLLEAAVYLPDVNSNSPTYYLSIQFENTPTSEMVENLKNQKLGSVVDNGVKFTSTYIAPNNQQWKIYPNNNTNLHYLKINTINILDDDTIGTKVYGKYHIEGEGNYLLTNTNMISELKKLNFSLIFTQLKIADYTE
jgi:hypothetical protein